MTSLATIALSKVFPSWKRLCKEPLFRAVAAVCGLGFSASTLYGAFGGDARGAGPAPLSAAVPTLFEIAPRMSESA